MGPLAIYADAIISLPPPEANLGQLTLESKLHNPQRLMGQHAFCLIPAQEGATFLGNLLLPVFAGKQADAECGGTLEPRGLAWQLPASLSAIRV